MLHYKRHQRTNVDVTPTHRTQLPRNVIASVFNVIASVFNVTASVFNVIASVFNVDPGTSR